MSRTEIVDLTRFDLIDDAFTSSTTSSPLSKYDNAGPLPSLSLISRRITQTSSRLASRNSVSKFRNKLRTLSISQPCDYTPTYRGLSQEIHLYQLRDGHLAAVRIVNDLTWRDLIPVLMDMKSDQMQPSHRPPAPTSSQTSQQISASTFHKHFMAQQRSI